MTGNLYVVATPLGNLEDITLRAVRVLKEVALIAAEDTRHSRILLEHFGIHAPLTSYFDHVERQRAPHLIERMKRGADVALICDAGTPAIADPGYRLVRAAIEAGIRVVPIPGPSAVMAALCAAGVPTDRFAFEGFIPPKAAARRAFLTRLVAQDHTVVCFEAGRRLAATLADLATLGPERRVVVARELTKVYEHFARGTATDLAERAGDLVVRGEVTLLIAPPSQPVPAMSAADVRREVARRRAAGARLKEIAKTLAADSGWSVRDIYRIGVESEPPEPEPD
jgi:16S rRNA (cytidine1402-2'-O)-methyltransferase